MPAYKEKEAATSALEFLRKQRDYVGVTCGFFCYRVLTDSQVEAVDGVYKAIFQTQGECNGDELARQVVDALKQLLLQPAFSGPNKTRAVECCCDPNPAGTSYVNKVRNRNTRITNFINSMESRLNAFESVITNQPQAEDAPLLQGGQVGGKLPRYSTN